MSFNKLLLISLLINIYLSDNPTTAPNIISELTCGKDSPTEKEDCTKYGTGSGMLCCWVAESKNSPKGKCYLLPQSLAESDTYKIDGEKEFASSSDGYKFWSCGNKSNFINLNVLIILLILFSL